MPSGPGAVTAALARAGYGPPLPPAMLAKLDAANTPAPQSTDASRQTIIVLPNSVSPSTKSKARAERPAAQPATKRWRATAHLAHHNGPPTAARQIYAACDAICALDPPVQGKKAARAAAAGQGVTTQTADIVMRRWETTKLVKMFPLDALCGLSGLSHDSLARRDPNDIAQFLLAKFGKVSYATVRNSRQALTRLIAYMHARALDWEERFSTLAEIDLFAFLMEVHVEAIANGTASRPGFGAVWGVFSGIHYLSPHFNLPTEEVRSSLPHKGAQHGVESILEGSLPLPPAALQMVCDYAADPRTPPVMVSWAHALAFTVLSSLRQANEQRLCNYGILTFGGRDYLVSQHTDGKSRTNLPTVFLTPIQDLRDCRRWFDRGRTLLWDDGDFLWANADGNPLLSSSRLLRCPLPDGKIMEALRLVLRHACDMSPAMTLQYTKHSARKKNCVHGASWRMPLGTVYRTWTLEDTSLDNNCLLPTETVRRKKALTLMSMPVRYAANARIVRVARIITHQIHRLGAYLRLPHSVNRNPQDWTTQWHLMPQYNRVTEGS